MCWNGIIHTLMRSTGSLLQRVEGADPSWVAASAVVRGRRAGLKRRPTLSQSIFPSLTLSLSPSGSCAFLAAAARCECVCVHGQEYLHVCDCWNPPRFSLCVICKSAQQLLSWHYTLSVYTHTYSYWTLLKHHLLSAYTHSKVEGETRRATISSKYL